MFQDLLVSDPKRGHKLLTFVGDLHEVAKDFD